jgi:hypothetical protein
MRTLLMLGLLTALPVASACSSAKAEAKPGGHGTVTVEGATFAVSDVKFAYQPGRSFRIEADDAGFAGKDCVPGVHAGVSLHGDLPSGVNSPVELSDKEVPFDFSGDGDDRSLCFGGSNQRLGVDKGTVKFGRVYGGAIGFTFSGNFKRVDGEGGKSGSTVHASGSGTATIQ